MHVYRPTGALELGSETCSSCDPERYDHGVSCCFTAEQGTRYRLQWKAMSRFWMFYFFPERSHPLYLSGKWKNDSFRPHIVNSPGVSTSVPHMEYSNFSPAQINEFIGGCLLPELFCYVEICKHYLAREKVALGLWGGGWRSYRDECLCVMMCGQAESESGSLLNSQQMSRLRCQKNVNLIFSLQSKFTALHTAQSRTSLYASEFNQVGS